MTIKKYTTIYKIITILCSTVIGLLFLEIVCRMAGPEYHRFANNSSVYFSNPRGYYTTVGESDGQTLYGIPYKFARQENNTGLTFR